MTAADRLIEALAGAHVKSYRNGFRAKCPGHDGQSKDSLSITPIEGSVMLKCFGGCDTADVLASLELTFADLYDESRGATYTCTDRDGRPTRTVHRTPDKAFRQSGHDPAATAELYRLPRVLEAVAAGTPVFVVEGEKDVHALERLGAVATTSPMGATNWHKADPSPLYGAHVVVVPDRDPAGDTYLQSVLASLGGKAASIKVMRAKEGKDAADHIAAGHQLADLVEDPGPHLPSEQDAADAFSRAVDREAHGLRVKEAATRIVRQERAGALDEPPLVSLTELLAVEDEDALYRVAEVWPVGGRVVLAAQHKAGKTTTRNNLIRSLADGDPFLDHFPVEPFEGRVVVIDNELDERMLRRWLRDQGIRNTDRVHVLALRGKVATFDLLDEACRARWAAKLRQVGTAVVLFDCLRPVLDALGLSEDKDAGRFLVAFDALLAEAGAPEGVVVHHMGHNGERSRGDTRIRDWPDVEWTLVRDKTDDGEQDSSGPRYFRAYGRDVDVPESLVEYDPITRHQRIAGGSRRETAGSRAVPQLLDYLRENPGATGRAIETALGAGGELRRADIRSAMRKACADGLVDTTEGARRAVLHFLTVTGSAPECASAPSAPSVRRQCARGVECASAPIGRTHTQTQSEVVSAPGALDQPPEPMSLLPCDCDAPPGGEHWEFCHAFERVA